MRVEPDDAGMEGRDVPDVRQVNEVRYKIGSKSARETIAALAESCPWWAKPQLAELLENIDERGVEIRITKAKRKHTSEQQGYYWLCIGIFAKSYGCGPDEMHEVILMEAFGSREVKTPNTSYKVPTTRSSKLDVAAYSELIETLMRCAAFNGCVLPDPQAAA
jgi:hypothetical protein